MINPQDFYENLINCGFSFFTGVPDSTLSSFCNCIESNSNNKHIIAANEGNALSIACGYNLATSKYGVVYLQNSGLGNIINPLLSLADEKVYSIPALLLIGYRGEPNTKDEPQHITQGELTLPLLDTLKIKYIILEDDYVVKIRECLEYIKTTKKTIALIVRKNTFSKYERQTTNNNANKLSREAALKIIIENLSSDDFIVSTTGKTSREIFEIREKNNQTHSNDFLTVGSMGHTSSLAFGVSLNSKKNIFCIDGDGSFIMHMGGLAVAIQNAGNNFKYILINNGCHESVGKQPTISKSIDIPLILKGFGFKEVYSVNTEEELRDVLSVFSSPQKTAVIVNTNSLSRNDLGRPTIPPICNKKDFERKLRE